MRALAILLLALSAAGAAAAAPRATVSIGDASLSPARVRVDAGGSVVWRNTGSRAHRVASATRAFATFTLAPRASRVVRFARNGAHRYTVDGRRCGIVYVGVPLGAGCTSGAGGGGATRPPSGTRTYTYDVVLRGSILNEGFVDSGGRRENTWSRALTWTSTFRAFRFKVVSGGSVVIGLNANDTFVNSTAQVVETWDWLWHPHSAFGPSADCDGRVGRTVPYRLFASGGTLPPNFRVAGQAPNGWTVSEDQEADCSGFIPPTIEAPDFTWSGLTSSADVGTLTVELSRRTGGFTSPAGQLLNGRAFTLDTGPQTSQQTTCDGDCSGTLTITQRYVAIFTPRR